MIDIKRNPRLNRGSSQGQLSYWDATLNKWTFAETSELFWDDTNKRLGIGTATPTYKLEVKGTATTDEIRSHMGFDIYPVPAPTSGQLTGVLQTGTDLEIGVYRYYVTYITAIGETSASSAQGRIITTTAGNQDVLLTIPVSTDARVTGRRLYRTKVNGAYYSSYYLADVANNTETTYLDSIPDASLPASTTTGVSYGKSNTTSNYISIDGTPAMLLDANLTAIGVGVGKPAGAWNTVIGYQACQDGTSALANAYIGYQTAQKCTTAFSNVAIGSYALQNSTVNRYNIAIGYAAMRTTTSNIYECVAIGVNSLNSVSGRYNTAIGSSSGYTLTSGTYNLFLGYNSGYNDLQSLSCVYSTALGAGSWTDKSYQMAYGGTNITEHLFRAGKVGIGGTPAQMLHVQSADGTTRIRIDSRNATPNAGLELYANTTFLGGFLGSATTCDFYGPAGIYGVVLLGSNNNISFSRGDNGVRYGLFRGDNNTWTFGTGTGTGSRVTIQGAGDTSATSALSVTNLSATSIIHALNDGRVGIGTASPTAILHLKAGTATANTAPLKFTTGTANTTAEAGAMEFTTDDLTFVITTGTARKGIVLDDGARLTSGKIPVATTNGRLVDLTAQAHEADLKTDYTTGDLDTEAEIITAINATNSKINALLVKLENLGLLSTS